MGFTPNAPKSGKQIEYYDDVASGNGWQGQTTTKSIETLKSEIVTSISRLGGIVSGFVAGTDLVTINDEKVICDGFRIHYSMETQSGKFIPGQIDIIALPVKRDQRLIRSLESRKLGAIKMALYMFREAMDGMWFMEQLSPGYVGLMPFMLAEKNKTLSQLFIEQEKVSSARLLPSGDNSIEGEFRELK